MTFSSSLGFKGFSRTDTVIVQDTIFSTNVYKVVTKISNLVIRENIQPFTNLSHSQFSLSNLISDNSSFSLQVLELSLLSGDSAMVSNLEKNYICCILFTSARRRRRNSHEVSLLLLVYNQDLIAICTCN